MTDLDRAIASAREALAKYWDGDEMSGIGAAVDGLLAALDAARGEAVAYRFWDSEEDRWQWGEAACAEKDDELLYAAPPAAVFKSTAKRVAALQARDAEQTPPAADEALADTQRAIIEAAERRGYERGLKEAPPAAVVQPEYPSMFEFFVVMQKRSSGEVFPDLHKTNGQIYFTEEDAARALDADPELKPYRHVVRLLAQVTPPAALAEPAANVTPMRQPRADLARLVESINAAVYANGNGLSVTEAIGALELAKLELLKEQEQ